MRTRRLPFLVPGLALAVCAATALGLGSDHPADQPVTGQNGWPAGLAELLNAGGRVGGFFVNASDWFFFQGDAKAFNAWLEKYAALKDTPLRLVLHPGRATERRPARPPPARYSRGRAAVAGAWEREDAPLPGAGRV